MKKVIVLGIITVLVLAVAAYAADPEKKEIKGQVQEMNLTQNVLIIVNAGTPYKFELTADTTYMIGTQGKLPGTSIKPKDMVSVEYNVVKTQGQPDKNIALTVRVLLGAK